MIPPNPCGRGKSGGTSPHHLPRKAVKAHYQVYTLLNSEGRRYIGVSNDVDRRLAQHNQGLSTWTRGRGPWLLEWISTPRTLGEARKLENQLKRQKGGGGLDRILRTEGPAPKASGS
jgi:putative endonuclease